MITVRADSHRQTFLQILFIIMSTDNLLSQQISNRANGFIVIQVNMCLQSSCSIRIYDCCNSQQNNLRLVGCLAGDLTWQKILSQLSKKIKQIGRNQNLFCNKLIPSQTSYSFISQFEIFNSLGQLDLFISQQQTNDCVRIIYRSNDNQKFTQKVSLRLSIHVYVCMSM